MTQAPPSKPVGRAWLSRLWTLPSFAFYFIRILIIANWQVARIVLSPAMPVRPRLFRYKVAGLSPAQVTILANAITLTPGTLVVDINAAGDCLYIHAIDAPDRAAAVLAIDELRDRLIREVF